MDTDGGNLKELTAGGPGGRFPQLPRTVVGWFSLPRAPAY